ncbi:MAG: hypothetical protein ACJAVR_002419 [Paracoccaceae bacterium]|jgi:hypothetical protein
MVSAPIQPCERVRGMSLHQRLVLITRLWRAGWPGRDGAAVPVRRGPAQGQKTQQAQVFAGPRVTRVPDTGAEQCDLCPVGGTLLRRPRRGWMWCACPILPAFWPSACAPHPLRFFGCRARRWSVAISPPPGLFTLMLPSLVEASSATTSARTSSVRHSRRWTRATCTRRCRDRPRGRQSCWCRNLRFRSPMAVHPERLMRVLRGSVIRALA